MPTKTTERLGTRMHAALIERLDAWRRKQGDLPSCAEAIRRLVEQALTGEKLARLPLRTKTKRQWFWLLAKIDKMGAKSDRVKSARSKRALEHALLREFVKSAPRNEEAGCD